ncbi:MAG: sigma-70 family RNA polymerase sigma factor [Bacteroidota bacterium]|nr:sigma-70 family RNA polymerase sigma factor [Bacteroidota bacterium]MDP4190326.1 sigma-70 family RNA polymerase sigma factor [Bacteroidota bacterium]MDP4193546.1 sigma-70 family RNA polymerase sigma factor [Bacteroidota bacterium]
MDESELIERCRNGEQQAFSEIIRRYKGKIASTIFGMLGRCDEADDIGQEVFIRFYKSVNNFRGESALGTYLTRIAINLSLNEIKRRKLRSFLSFEKLIEEGKDIMDIDAKSSLDENKEIIQKAIQKLSSKYRSVLVLRLIDDYSTEETAKILNLPVGTVLSRLARAQIKLREYLKPYLSEI